VRQSDPRCLAELVGTKGGGLAQHYPHGLNFLDCLKSRQKPNSDVETMHRSTSAGLLGVIAFKLRRKLAWDAQQEQFPGDPEANDLQAGGDFVDAGANTGIYSLPASPWVGPPGMVMAVEA